MTIGNLLSTAVSTPPPKILWPVASEEFLPTLEGGQLFVRIAEPAAVARAVVLLTHGLGEHSGRYGHVAASLLARGLRVAAWDLRGHGRSSGGRGDVTDYRLLLQDLAAVCNRCRLEGVPLFLFAHSMGGQFVLRAVEEDLVACDGAVVASPWLRLAFDPPWWKLALARLALLLHPGFLQATGNRWERLSRDVEHLGSFPDLDLVHHRISARMYFFVRAEGEKVLAQAEKFGVPLMLLHGDQDPITSHRATAEFCERAGSSDKTLRIYPGGVHETHNDLDRELVLREVGDWIERRLPVKS